MPPTSHSSWARTPWGRWTLTLFVLLGCSAAAYLAWYRLTPRPESANSGVEEFDPGNGWKRMGEALHHRVLKDASVVQWQDRRNTGGLRLATLEVGGRYLRIRSTSALPAFLSSVGSVDDAIAVSDLVRMLMPSSQQDWGVLLRPAEGRIPETARGKNGRYTEFDCRRWGVPEEPAVEPLPDGGYAVRRIALRVRPGGWQLQVVMMLDIVGPDGAFRSSLDRVLDEDGRDYDVRWL